MGVASCYWTVVGSFGYRAQATIYGHKCSRGVQVYELTCSNPRCVGVLPYDGLGDELFVVSKETIVTHDVMRTYDDQRDMRYTTFSAFVSERTKAYRHYGQRFFTVARFIDIYWQWTM